MHGLMTDAGQILTRLTQDIHRARGKRLKRGGKALYLTINGPVRPPPQAGRLRRAGSGRRQPPYGCLWAAPAAHRWGREQGRGPAAWSHPRPHVRDS
jgi:hypothetical protein